MKIKLFCVHLLFLSINCYFYVLKGAMAATFRAINAIPTSPTLQPVEASKLARRRQRSRPKSSTE